MQIPITKPFFGHEEMEAVRRPLEAGWVVQGPFVKQFEEAMCRFTSAGFAAATSSCTSALHVALAALGVKPGDEVIVPAFTWVSTANVVEYMGARPVFCDIDLQTFNIDVRQLAGLVTSRTAGIIPVHLFGLCADMDEVLAIARRHGLWVVEDAACAFGAEYRGRHSGTFGEMGCFSFHPRKSITTGEGGMVTTAREDLYTRVCSLRDHGASRTDLARHQARGAFLLAEYRALGYNYRMTDIQGALGCAQMGRADWLLAQRARLARRYDEMLSDVSWLSAPVSLEGCVHAYQAYVGMFSPETPTLGNVDRLHRQRNELMMRLEDAGVSTRQGTHAPVILDYYAQKYHLRALQFPNAYLADRLSMALPLFPQLTEAEQETVVAELERAFRTD